jgi:hypothetical protein
MLSPLQFECAPEAYSLCGNRGCKRRGQVFRAGRSFHDAVRHRRKRLLNGYLGPCNAGALARPIALLRTMHYEAAVDLARIVEDLDDSILVAGFRLRAETDLDSWALDVVNVRSGTMVTIDEKDDISAALQRLLPQ